MPPFWPLMTPASSGEPARGNPITDITACCARAANGMLAAAPPTNVTNARRFIAHPARTFSTPA
jgi:hypothetical protein